MDSKSTITADSKRKWENNFTDSELDKIKLLTNILESSTSVSSISTDLNQNVIYWNKGAENIFGYKKEEIVGKKKIDIIYFDSESKKNCLKSQRKDPIHKQRNRM